MNRRHLRIAVEIAVAGVPAAVFYIGTIPLLALWGPPTFLPLFAGATIGIVCLFVVILIGGRNGQNLGELSYTAHVCRIAFVAVLFCAMAAAGSAVLIAYHQEWLGWLGWYLPIPSFLVILGHIPTFFSGAARHRWWVAILIFLALIVTAGALTFGRIEPVSGIVLNVIDKFCITVPFGSQPDCRLQREHTESARKNELAASQQKESLRKLAQTGDIDARYQLGLRTSGEERMRWLCLAANEGHAAAQYEYGVRLEIERDDAATAYRWYALSKRGGYWQAPEAMSRLEGILSPAEVTQARSLVEQWAGEECP